MFLQLLLLLFMPFAPQTPPQVDADFASAVKQWTTKPEFISPLVDHLPLKAGVPTPKDILGHHIGEPKKLSYTADQQRFFRALESALPGRVKTMVAGKTEEGRDIFIVFITSEENMKNLEQNRQNMKRLADSRGLSEQEAARLIAATPPHYHISAGLHSAETSPGEMVMELGYRLAVSDEPYIRQIRDNVIVSIAPTTEVDGRDRYVDWYYAYKIDEPAGFGAVNYGGPPYWGKYVFHDNNRDINLGVDSLRAHLEWYLHWVPPVWHDLHEAQPLLYTFSGQPPQNANLDPILYTELPFFANYEVNKLTTFGMPGVWHFGFVDTWSPGYLGFAASNHNGMLRMYEIFNQGGANTKKARMAAPANNGANETPREPTREWYRPLPATGEFDWSIRNSINYSETALLSALELTSKFPSMVVENFYKKSLHAVENGRTKAPYAFVIPAGQRDQTQVDRVVNLIRRQAIEVSRASSKFKIGETEYGAGSYVIKMNQPYGPLAKTLLEKQNYPEGNLRTYDDSAWTMGLASNIEIKTINDKAILEEPVELLQADAVTKGSATGPAGRVIVVSHNGSLNLITLRYRLKDMAFKGAKASFKSGETEFPAGSFLIPVAGNQAARVRREIENLGLVATIVPSMPDVETVDLDLPRIAIYTTWQNTEKVGWVRLAFDRWEIPYDLIHKDNVQTGANLHAKYDVIVMPHQGNGSKSIVYEAAKLTRPLPYKKNDKFKTLGAYTETDDVRGGMGLAGAAEFARFVEEGGVLMTFGVSSFFPADFGIAGQVDAQRTQGTFYGPGPYVQTEIVQPRHPILFGYTGKNIPMRWADGPLLSIPSQRDQRDQPRPAAETAAAPPPPPAPPEDDGVVAHATVLVRFTGGDSSVLSGVMRGTDQIRNRPAIIDAPVGKGRVIYFVNNPIYRWQTFGEHELVFNALLYFNDMPASSR
jgi:hypothetical protein